MQLSTQPQLFFFSPSVSAAFIVYALYPPSLTAFLTARHAVGLCNSAGFSHF